MNVKHTRIERKREDAAAEVKPAATVLRAILFESCERFGMSPRRVSWPKFAALILMVVGALQAATPEGQSPSRTDFPSFKVIAERNIFNANRSRGRSGTEKPRIVDSLSLLGTMSYERGQFAFFDGSKPEYKKTLKPDATIAGYKIAEIAPNGVKLEAEGKQIDLPVGSQMRREEEGEWEIVATTETSSIPSRSNASDFRSRGGPDLRSGRGGSDPRSNRFGGDSRFNRRDTGDSGFSRRTNSPEVGPARSNASGTTSESTSPADTSEIIKRLMQQREQEDKK
jgi:hypothetical protein